jgi:hypothetical protein
MGKTMSEIQIIEHAKSALKKQGEPKTGVSSAAYIELLKAAALPELADLNEKAEKAARLVHERELELERTKAKIEGNQSQLVTLEQKMRRAVSSSDLAKLRNEIQKIEKTLQNDKAWIYRLLHTEKMARVLGGRLKDVPVGFIEESKLEQSKVEGERYKVFWKLMMSEKAKRIAEIQSLIDQAENLAAQWPEICESLRNHYGIRCSFNGDFKHANLLRLRVDCDLYVK